MPVHPTDDFQVFVESAQMRVRFTRGPSSNWRWRIVRTPATQAAPEDEVVADLAGLRRAHGDQLDDDFYVFVKSVGMRVHFLRLDADRYEVLRTPAPRAKPDDEVVADLTGLEDIYGRLGLQGVGSLKSATKRALRPLWRALEYVERVTQSSREIVEIRRASGSDR